MSPLERLIEEYPDIPESYISYSRQMRTSKISVFFVLFGSVWIIGGNLNFILQYFHANFNLIASLVGAFTILTGLGMHLPKILELAIETIRRVKKPLA